MLSVKLVWIGPFSFTQIVRKDGIAPEFKGHGVYVWINRIHKRISYVGKADTLTLWRRQFQWYWNGISGQLLIPGEGPKNYSWDPGKEFAVDIITDEERYVELVHRAFRYMKNYEIYIASAHDKAIIRKIEKLLLFYLQPDDTPYPKVAPECDFVLSHENAPWETEAFALQIREPSNKAMQATCADTRA